MTAFFPLLSHLTDEATGALVSAIWQGALLAALVGITLRIFPRLSAAARSIIWLNVFILLALLHLVPFALGSSPAPNIASHAVLLDSRWSLVIGSLWLALSLFRAVQLVVSAAHLRNLAGRAVPVESTADLDALLVAPFSRRVQLCASTEVARPSVLGFFRPRVLVPPAVLENLSPDELRQVVIHEMEHLRRGDDWTNLLQKIALVIFPLNPALLWVERRLCAERELACDDRVLSSGSGRKAYALCLTHLAEISLMRRGFSLVLGAWERRPELVRRVQRILAQPVRTMGRKPALAISAALLSGVIACTLTLAHAPQLIAFVPAPGLHLQAQVFSRTGAAVDAASADRWDGGATMIHTLGGNPARAINTVLRTDALPQLAPLTAHNVALKSHPAKTFRPCQLKLALRRRNLPQLQPARLTALRTSLEPVPAACPRRFAVLAQMSELQNATRAIDTIARERYQRRINVVSAIYVVRTPVGWVIVEI